MHITKRKDAQLAGLKKYFTGTPCARGHLTFRYTNTGACTACISGYAKHYQARFNCLKPKMLRKVFEFLHADDVVLIEGLVTALNLERSKVVDKR